MDQDPYDVISYFVGKLWILLIRFCVPRLLS
jgi:hypothetical protein